jgi:hypothetical protein
MIDVPRGYSRRVATRAAGVRGPGAGHEGARGSRPLAVIVVADQIYVRNLVGAGAFDDLPPSRTHWVASARKVRDDGALRTRANYHGRVADPAWRARWYGRLELVTRAARRRRSTTLALKHRLLPRGLRLRASVAGLPGVNRVARRMILWRLGGNDDLHALIRRLRPRVVIAPTGGNDALVNDAVASARRLAIPSLVIVHNWDGLSGKGALSVVPDRVAVWGPQARAHATEIQGIASERVVEVGSPLVERYLDPPRDEGAAAFPFPYVLFAGCYAPFDEERPLRLLDDAFSDHAIDLTIVYRPHPHRAPRNPPDRIVASSFRRVLLDPAVRDAYEQSFVARDRDSAAFPPLHGYPALLRGAALVVCPLSTMLLEASACGRPVVVIAFGDGKHRQAPDLTYRYDHFRGIERLPGVVVAHSHDDMIRTALRLAQQPSPAVRPVPADFAHWVSVDERPYPSRIAAIVTALAET